MIVQLDTFVVVISNSDDNTLKKSKRKLLWRDKTCSKMMQQKCEMSPVQLIRHKIVVIIS